MRRGAIKRKATAVGLGLLAFALAGAVSGPAPATTGGHFTTGAEHVLWQDTAHVPFVFTVSGAEVRCSKGRYEGTTVSTTAESVTLVPTYEQCEEWFVGEQRGVVAVTRNGCVFQLTIGQKALADNTAHLLCPIGQRMEFHLPNQTLALPPQTFTGVAFKAGTGFPASTLTIEFTATGLTAHCEGGLFCAWGGTESFGGLDGSLTVRGFDTFGEPVGIKATGSEG
jgi:hypothetical protein